jgi:alginate O-acetyltransferase complex protein AlgI
MVFSSLEFLCVFLPVVIVLYSVIPSLPVKNALLILASLAFYAYGEPVYVLLMIGSALINWLFALAVDKAGQKTRQKKIFLAVDVVLNLGVLAIFKYTAFFVTSLNDAFSLDIPVPDISLPIGISFFTFQALSYVIDVYRKDTEVQKNFFKVLLYISFFPQLIAGPIVKYHDISKALSERTQSFEATSKGLKRFAIGLSKKVLIANTMGQVADTLFNTDGSRINIISAWIAAVAYMLQIYYDFSGYSDMAIGLGKVFGFEFAENFNHPYGSTSIKEFWRRWHISLSTWFKEYLYIPLGGNRKGRARTSINKIIVFFTTGLWHGANWTFVIWGLYHGAFLLLEDYIPKLKKLPKVIGHIYALLVVCVGFVIFRADNITQAFAMISKMFCSLNFTPESISLTYQMLTPYFIVMLIAGVLFAAPIPALYEHIIRKRQTVELQGAADSKDSQPADVRQGAGWVEILSYTVSLVLLVWCMLRLSGSTYNPFIYFRF